MANNFIKSKIRTVVIGVLFTFLIGFIDYATGYEIFFSVFYLLPIFYVSWRTELRTGIMMSLLSMVTWHLNDFMSGHVYSIPEIAYWNALMRGIIFCTVTFLSCRLKAALISAQELSKKAAEASSAKSFFLSNMSHEIRTPLTAILGVSELLMDTPLNAEQIKYVMIFKKEGEHLLKIINDILDISKIEASKFDIEKVPFNLKTIIDEVSSIMKINVSEKGLALNVNVQNDIPEYLIGAPHCIRRILMNLINNSMKFTPKGSISLQAECTVDLKQSCNVLFTIRDTGIGIAEDKIGLLFKPFVQADSSITRNFGGTGLGLAITMNLLKLMGGNIRVESKVNEGTAFFFTVPFALPEKSVVESLISSKENQAKDRSGSRNIRALKILLADDYETNRIIVKLYLKDRPHIIDEAENGEIALKKFKANKYDIVLMDMQMPEMDGFTATRLIREWEKENSSPTTPVIALTAYAFKEETEKLTAAGCDDFLTKPFNREKLLETIIKKIPFDKKPSIYAVYDNDNFLQTTEMKELIKFFLKEVRTFLNQLNEADEKNDYKVIEMIGHKLKGGGGSVGYPEISEIGNELELAAIINDNKAVKKHINKLSAYLKTVEVTNE